MIDTVTARPRRGLKTSGGVNDPAVKAKPVWTPELEECWRAVWQYTERRATKDRQNLIKQENRAKAVVAGDKAAKPPRFVTASKDGMRFNQAAFDRAKSLVGLKGYVTNIPSQRHVTGRSDWVVSCVVAGGTSIFR